MGGTRFDPGAWTTYAATNSYATKTTEEIYDSTGLQDELNPKKITVRESCDSDANPKSTPIIVGLDVTGSMSPVLDSMARKGLVTLMKEIYERKPVTDPHLMYMGIGDIRYDSAPLQATQFEAGADVLAKALEKLWLEQGGGGNMSESYPLAWLFAATKTKIDSFQKRGKKGYLFTVGDELPGDDAGFRREDLERIGLPVEADLTLEAVLTLASRQWEIFHLIVQQGYNYTDRVLPAWRKLIGQRAIPLADHTKMSEVIVSTIQVIEGEDKATVAKSWDGTTNIVVSKAIEALTPAAKSSKGGTVKL